MPNKINDSNSTLASDGSNDQVVVIQGMLFDLPSRLVFISILIRIDGTNPPRRTQKPVVIHNQGGQIYDETRPSDWDKQRWK